MEWLHTLVESLLVSNLSHTQFVQESLLNDQGVWQQSFTDGWSCCEQTTFEQEPNSIIIIIMADALSKRAHFTLKLKLHKMFLFC